MNGDDLAATPPAPAAPADSLGARLLRIVFGCYFVVTLAVTCVQLAAEYRHTGQRLEQEIGAMRQTFGTGITDAMWRFNTDVLRGILTGMQQLPAVIGVKIVDEHGKLVRATGIVQDAGGQRARVAADGSLVPAAPNGKLFDRLFSQSFDIVHVDETGERQRIGAWTVYSGERVIVERVQYGFVLILVNSALKTLALWFIFLFVIRRALGRPLQQLAGFVGQLNIDNVGKQVFVLDSPGRNELHLLADKVNQMAATLKSSVAQNAALYDDVKEMNRTLEAQVAARTIELQRVASTDTLTGLYNRRKLDEVMAQEILRVQRYRGQLAVILADVDYFKATNDAHGHQVGDLVLAGVAAVLRGGARKVDSVGRWGGEEFMVVCPHTDMEGALALAEQLRVRIEGYSFHLAGHKTASFGVAVLAPGETVEQLVARADAALYRAKEAGRNRVQA